MIRAIKPQSNKIEVLFNGNNVKKDIAKVFIVFEIIGVSFCVGGHETKFFNPICMAIGTIFKKSANSFRYSRLNDE